MFTDQQRSDLRYHERELVARLHRLNQELRELGYFDGAPVPEPFTVVEGSEDIIIDLTFPNVNERMRIQAALSSEEALAASYIQLLLTLERTYADALADPHDATRDTELPSRLNDIRKELPAWKDAFWKLTGKHIGLPGTTEETRDAHGQVTWIIKYDENGYGTTVFHMD